MIKRGEEPSAFTLVDLLAKGEFASKSRDWWRFVTELCGLTIEFPALRQHLYDLLAAQPDEVTAYRLAEVLLESPDERGLLLLLDIGSPRIRSLVAVPHGQALITCATQFQSKADMHNLLPR